MFRAIIEHPAHRIGGAGDDRYLARHRFAEFRRITELAERRIGGDDAGDVKRADE